MSEKNPLIWDSFHECVFHKSNKCHLKGGRIRSISENEVEMWKEFVLEIGKREAQPPFQTNDCNYAKFKRWIKRKEESPITSHNKNYIIK